MKVYVILTALIGVLAGCSSVYHVTDAEGRRTEVTCKRSFWSLNESTCVVQRPGEIKP